jgi:hypothetical protein
MPTLYVANPTNQRQIVSFRLDINKSGEREINQRFQPARQQDIPAGQQVVLGSRDMHENQITSIMDQLKPYGLFQVKELGSIKANDRVTYLCNIGLVVPPSAIRTAEMHNKRLKFEEGRQRRANAAIATDATVQQVVEQQFLEKGIDAQPADSTTVTFEQLDEVEGSEDSKVAEGFEVVPEGKIGTVSGKPAARGKGRGRRG